MNTVYLLCGPIGCGKSTLAKKLGWVTGSYIIDHDQIVSMIHGDYQHYDPAKKPLYHALEASLYDTLVGDGEDVIVDRCMPTKVERRRFLELTPDDTYVVCYHFEEDWRQAPAVHATNRYRSDPRGLTYETWVNVAERMKAAYEPPSINEGFDEIVGRPDIDLLRLQEEEANRQW